MSASQRESNPHAALRKRKAHKKSKLGCRNCKMRRVKCDEARPECTHCLDFGVSCNYDPKVPDLQLRRGAAIYINAIGSASPSVHESMLSMINASDQRNRAVGKKADGPFRFDTQDLERLGRFQNRTVLTIGTKRTAEVYHATLIHLACNHKYLMHMVQALTAVHDRYLALEPRLNQNTVETYHLGQALILFNEKLSGSIDLDEGDAIWSTAAILGLVSFAIFDASTPEDAWPLKPPSRTDLEWLAMSDGKKAVWNIANPMQSTSAFHKLSDDFERDYFAAVEPKPGDGILLAEFANLCDLHDSSEDNPFYEAVHSLVPLLDLECNSSTMMRFLSFISHMNPQFRLLLEQKDACAMLLLAYWFSKAICIYLERYHNDLPNVQELLRFPKMRCGLTES